MLKKPLGIGRESRTALRLAAYVVEIRHPHTRLVTV
jgi:hypothetical protein